jgi:hypothetical protein
MPAYSIIQAVTDKYNALAAANFPGAAQVLRARGRVAGACRQSAGGRGAERR